MELAKYVLSGMLGLCLAALYGRERKSAWKWLLGAGFGMSVAAMELVTEYIWNEARWKMIGSVLKGMGCFSAVVLIGYLIEWIRISGSRADTEEMTPPHPVRDWIAQSQESFFQLSRSLSMVPAMAGGASRDDRILHGRLAQNRIAAAGQIQEMGQILAGSMERIYSTREDAGLEQEMAKKLRFLGLQLYQAFFYSPQGKSRQVYLTMRAKRKICVPVKKIAGVLSDLVGYEMVAARDSRNIISQEKVTVLFVEAPAYNVLYGVKKEVRPGEPVCGDNFSVFYLPDGHFFTGVSDGMGSGVQACAQSEMVLDLMEQFLEAGFSKETALRMINSSMVLHPGELFFSTMDAVSMDLYTGICEFLKLGAATSFIRRGDKVECVHGQEMAIGIDGELNLQPYRTRLYDGNMIFLVTDGVMGVLPKGEEESTLQELIRTLPLGTPGEMAQKLLERVKTYGEGVDDMTILVAGIWKR